LHAAFTSTPGQFANFARKINAGQSQLNSLGKRLGREISLQEDHINGMAITALRKQKHKLENYQIRASYSLTRLYDSLAKLEKKKP